MDTGEKMLLTLVAERHLDRPKRALTPEELLKLMLDRVNKDHPGKTVVEKRNVKAGDLNAAWVVCQTKADGAAEPARVDAFLLLQSFGHNVIIHGVYEDDRPTRTAKDFENAQQEFLKLSQTFRAKPN